MTEMTPTSARRYVVLAAAVLMQLCLGATYSWSVYVDSLQSLTGLSLDRIHIPFTVFYLVFPATLLVSGVLLNRLGPRVCAVGGGILFGGGWLVAGLGSHHFLFTVLGIGLLGGIGAGFGYLVPLAAGVMWFPRHKGFVTGITMAGFGGGAALVSQIAGRLIANHGWTTFHAFQLFGAVFFLVVVTAGMFMRFPQPVSGTPHQTLSFSEVFHRRLFWLLYATMFTGLVAGFMVNANMTKLYTGPENIEAGILAVSAFAITNAVGRLTWGYIFDRIKTSTAIRLNLLSQGLLLLAGLWILRFPVGLVVFALLAGFNYGGLLVIHASSSARHWEGQHVGQVYGWLSSSNIPAALSPIAAGWVHNRTQTFSGPLLVVSLALILVGLFFSFRIEKHVSGTDH